jgi:hypothetical protein
MTEPHGGSERRRNKMPRTVPGIYKEGKIELLETPTGIPEGRVLVTVQPDDTPKPAPRYLQRGKYTKGRLSTEEDFKIAEWRGEDDLVDE